MSSELATSYHIEGLSPCFSQTVTAPRADLGSKGRLQTGTGRSRELGIDVRVSSTIFRRLILQV